MDVTWSFGDTLIVSEAAEFLAVALLGTANIRYRLVFSFILLAQQAKATRVRQIL